MSWIQLIIVAVALFVFQVGVSVRWLDRMPGSRWVDHSSLILLLLLPAAWWAYPLWVFGIFTFVDDFRQHYIRAHGRPEYRSWLHVWGWYTVGEPLRDWLARWFPWIRRVG